MVDPSWLTPPLIAVHTLDTYVLSEHPAERTARGRRLHSHLIYEDWSRERKRLVADHLDRHHGGIGIIEGGGD